MFEKEFEKAPVVLQLLRKFVIEECTMETIVRGHLPRLQKQHQLRACAGRMRQLMHAFEDYRARMAEDDEVDGMEGFFFDLFNRQNFDEI